MCGAREDIGDRDGSGRIGAIVTNRYCKCDRFACRRCRFINGLDNLHVCACGSINRSHRHIIGRNRICGRCGRASHRIGQCTRRQYPRRNLKCGGLTNRESTYVPKTGTIVVRPDRWTGGNNCKVSTWQKVGKTYHRRIIGAIISGSYCKGDHFIRIHHQFIYSLCNGNIGGLGRIYGGSGTIVDGDGVVCMRHRSRIGDRASNRNPSGQLQSRDGSNRDISHRPNIGRISTLCRRGLHQCETSRNHIIHVHRGCSIRAIIAKCNRKSNHIVHIRHQTIYGFG